MTSGIPKHPDGRRDRLIPDEPVKLIQVRIPEAAYDRFLLLYPKKGAMRLLFNAALRVALERPDLCPWLKQAYGKAALRKAWLGENPKVEHPLKSIRRDDFPLEPEVSLVDVECPPDGPRDAAWDTDDADPDRD